MTEEKYVFSIDNIDRVGGNAPYFPREDPRFMTIPLWTSRGGSVRIRLRDPGNGLRLLTPGTVPFEDVGSWYNAVVEHQEGWVHEGQTGRFDRLQVFMLEERDATWMGSQFGVEVNRSKQILEDRGLVGYVIRLPYILPDGANGFFQLLMRVNLGSRQRAWFRRPQDEGWIRVTDGEA